MLTSAYRPMSLHLLVVPFAMVLLVLGAAVDLYGAATGSPARRRTAGWLLIGGSLAAVLALVTGGGAQARLLAQHPAGIPAVEAHAQWGAAGVWLLAGAGVLRALWRTRTGWPHGWITLAVGLLAAALVVRIGLSGIAISHGVGG